jgi:putative copper resistance protein D
MDPAIALTVCRVLTYACNMLVFGVSGFLVFVAPLGLAGPLAVRCGRFASAAAFAIVLCVLAGLPLQAASVGNGWQDALDSGVVSGLVLDTDFGHVWLARLVLAVALAALVVLSWPGRMKPILAASGLLLVTHAFLGHAAMHGGGMGALHSANHAVHLIAAASWLGALPALLLTLDLASDGTRQTSAILALQRYSTYGAVAVAAVLVTGIGNTAFILGRWPLDQTSPYQVSLLAKLAAVALMLGLAAINRFVLVPRTAVNDVGTLRLLRMSVLAELTLGSVILILVAHFGLLDPA